IFDIEMGKLAKRVEDARQINLSTTEQAKEWILASKMLENVEYGARPLRRAIEHFIEHQLAEQILRGEFEGKNSCKVRVKDGELFFDKNFDESIAATMKAKADDKARQQKDDDREVEAAVAAAAGKGSEE